MTETNYWLMKSEPDVYGIDHLMKEKKTLWDGIRNYQARNFMRQMKIEDKVFFYHSNCKEPAIVGLMKVTRTGLTDHTQFEKSSKYYDQKSNKKEPRWDCVEVKFLQKFNKKLTLHDLRKKYSQDDLIILRKGNRLSIVPISLEIANDLIFCLSD